MDTYSNMASLIIKEQKHIMGPIAIMQANKVEGLHVTDENTIEINGDGKNVIQQLVEKYEKLFGEAAIQVCKEAIEPILYELKDTSDIPEILK